MWRIVDSELNTHCYDWLVHIWQSMSFTNGRCCDLGLKSINNYFKLSVRRDKAIVTKNSYSHLWCDFTVGSNIVGTALSFGFNLFENPASNCALFLNESTVKWSEQKTKFLLTWSGSSLKIKLIHSFLTLGSERRQHKHCFYTTWHCTASCWLRSIFIVWFLRRPARSPLS